MAQHRVEFAVPKRPLAHKDIEFEVWRNGKKFGELRVSQGNVVWLPADRTYGHWLTWQKLDKAIRNGLSRGPTRKTDPARGQAPGATEAVLRPLQTAGPLTERYRPMALDSLWGQPKAVAVLRKFAAAAYPAPFIFEGETGTGKTSAALALAAELGCRVDQKEYGGVWQIASGEQTADTVREMVRRMHLCPLMGSGWKVLIVNEVDRISRPAEMVWLDALEAIPPRTVIVFTTNEAGLLSQRFRDRCTRLTFESDPAKLRQSACRLLSAIWRAETGKPASAKWIASVVDGSVEDGRLSFRRAVQLLQPFVTTGQEGGES